MAMALFGPVSAPFARGPSHSSATCPPACNGQRGVAPEWLHQRRWHAVTPNNTLAASASNRMQPSAAPAYNQHCRQGQGHTAMSRRAACRPCRATGSDWAAEGVDPSEALGAKPPSECERSLLVNEETVYFIFQLDLDTQLQRCLNGEAYDAAQEVRKKRQRVGVCASHMDSHAS